MRLAFFVAALVTAVAAAQAPPGYYSTVDASSAAALRQTLHPVIDDHVRFPYTSSSRDTWDVLERASTDPSQPGSILDVYRNRSFRKVQDRVSGYNREHLWPKSLGYPIDGPTNYPFSDCHALFLCDAGYNTSRSNKPFDDCSASCAESPTDVNNGQGGGTGAYPGNSNWTSGSFTSGRWEVWRGRRGDVARALFYLDLRYEGGTHGGSGATEPDLVLTDSLALIQASFSNSINLSLAHMGLLSTLVQWHQDDPVDAWERARNDSVFGDQRNRNPFVDHPEWVGVLFGGSVPGRFETFGAGCAGANGFTPGISHLGEPLIGQTSTILLGLGPAGAPAVFNVDVLRRSVDLGSLGFAGCTALALPMFSLGAQTNGFGSATLPLAIPGQPELVGRPLHGQWVVLDAPSGIAVSNGGTLWIGRR